jgi:hypothetical protein
MCSLSGKARPLKVRDLGDRALWRTHAEPRGDYCAVKSEFMPVAAKLTHGQREQLVLTDLSASFPDFTGIPLSWTKVSDGRDPPDFLSVGQNGSIGLELIEWLDGGQMGPAKTRETKRKEALRILRTNWKAEYAPQNFRGAFIQAGEKKIAAADEAGLRKEFFDCAAAVDRTWLTNPERSGIALELNDFSGYPLMQTYFAGIRYIGGDPHGFCWIDVEGDGRAYDPGVTVETLKQALERKLSDYATPEKQAHLRAHALSDLYLLVHGGFNAFAYNSPSGPMSLENIAQRGAAFYAAHPQRQIFSRVWFFDSLDSADDLNQLIGYPPGYGRVRWLAQLWPSFSVYPGSDMDTKRETYATLTKVCGIK